MFYVSLGEPPNIFKKNKNDNLNHGRYWLALCFTGLQLFCLLCLIFVVKVPCSIHNYGLLAKTVKVQIKIFEGQNLNYGLSA